MNATEIVKALRAMGEPPLSIKYKGEYKWHAEDIARDAIALIESLQAELAALKERDTVRPPEPDKQFPGIGIGWCQVCKTELCIDDELLQFCPTCGQRLAPPPRQGKEETEEVQLERVSWEELSRFYVEAKTEAAGLRAELTALEKDEERLRELARATITELEQGLHMHKGDVGEMRIRPLALAAVKQHLWAMLPTAPEKGGSPI